MDKGIKIANEVWNMLPDSCKEIMKDIETSFKESISADVNNAVENKNIQNINNLTVGGLIDRLNFAIEHQAITKEHTICIGGNSDIYLIENIVLPAVILDDKKDYKKVQMFFTKI